MAVTNGYCTVAQLRAHLGDDNSALAAALLERAINATSRAIDRFCDRRFWQDSTTKARTYRPDDPELVWVDDIATTSGLQIATDTTGDGVFDTSWGSDEYQLEPLNADADGEAYAWWRIAAVDTRRFPVGGRRPRLQVTATFGWSAIPVDIEQAAILKAASLFRRKDAPFGVAGFNDFGPVRISRKDPDVAELLSPYVRVNMEAV